MIRLAGPSSFKISSTEQVYPFELHSDGRTLYAKYVNFGNIPNSGPKSVTHGLSGVSFYRWTAFLSDGTGSLFAFNAVDTNFGSWGRFYVTSTHLQVQTIYDYSNFTCPRWELYYAKS